MLRPMPALLHRLLRPRARLDRRPGVFAPQQPQQRGPSTRPVAQPLLGSRAVERQLLEEPEQDAGGELGGLRGSRDVKDGVTPRSCGTPFSPLFFISLFSLRLFFSAPLPFFLCSCSLLHI